MTTVISDAALQQAARSLATAMPNSRLPIGPQLEAWVLLVLGGCLQRSGIGVQSVPIGTFYVRMNQHKRLRGNRSSWLRLQYSGRPYEIHNSVQFAGRSGAHHEVDVCVIRGAPRVAPVTHRRLVAGIECKQHASAVSENVVRVLLGVALDCYHDYFFPSPQRFAVATTFPTLTSNTMRLADAYGISVIKVDAGTVMHTHPDINAFAARVIALL